MTVPEGRANRPAQEGEGVLASPDIGDIARHRDPRDAPRGEQARQCAEGLGAPLPLLGEPRCVIAAHGRREAEPPAELRRREPGGAEVVDDVRAGPGLHVERRDSAGADVLDGDGEREIAAGIPRDERVLRPVAQDQEAPAEGRGKRGLARHIDDYIYFFYRSCSNVSAMQEQSPEHPPMLHIRARVRVRRVRVWVRVWVSPIKAMKLY